MQIKRSLRGWMQVAIMMWVVTAVGAARADTWTTDDDFVDGSTAFAYGVQNDSTYVYAVGFGTVNGLDVALVRRRTLSAQTPDWKTVDTYTGDGQAMAQAVAIDTNNGVIYVAGRTYAGPTSSRWYVRTSKDQGNTWVMNHIGTVYSGGQNSIGDLRVTDAGIVSISAIDTAGTTHWVVKTEATGWGTIDLVTGTGTNSSAMPDRIAFDTNGALLVVGWIIDGTGSHWITRKNTSSGFVQIDSSASRGGQGILQDSGVLYATGLNLASTHWITRRSTNDGVSWTDVDNVSAGSSDSAGLALRDLSGVVYACGIYDNLWGVRKSTDGTTWTKSDSFDLGGDSGTAFDLTPGGGKMWVVGSAYDGSVDHWIVRTLQP